LIDDDTWSDILFNNDVWKRFGLFHISLALSFCDRVLEVAFEALRENATLLHDGATWSTIVTDHAAERFITLASFWVKRKVNDLFIFDYAGRFLHIFDEISCRYLVRGQLLCI